MGTDFVVLSLVPITIGILVCVSCALLGNFLVLRRQSLIGDAVSHVVLPGIVGAFIFTGTVAAGAMLLGAGIAAVLAVLLIEVVRRVGRVEPGAAMGVVFTTLFAAGVLLLEQSDTSSVHLDVEHALYGNLESLIWLAGGAGWPALLDPGALAALPPQLPRLALVTLAVVVFLLVFWKELVIGTFDATFAESVGARPGPVGFALIVMVAVAAVAAFDAVGSIIVIAMFICPPAAARLMTDRLVPQLGWSVAFAVVSAIAGYVLAGYGPLWLGAAYSVSAAGMIATVAGLILALACLAGPRRFGTRTAARRRRPSPGRASHHQSSISNSLQV
ncbi:MULTISPECIES: metal ABC transporter permease [Chelatococcus]|uniref:Manganese/zinc/iron transport system permease protein n=1 Tax=Chelatococcus caeni TaxID=1348468 RepID=A0A840C981_9HYPH|nr:MULTISPECIES: metal ABC transporter permease [Chelatococcus]MBB4019406.1 manganese/zinc/iron transport system permease protein [Chelatococcus caeni]